MFDDMLDHPILAGGIAALDQHQDAVTPRDQAALKLDQLDLQQAQVSPIAVLRLVGVRAGFAHLSPLPRARYIYHQKLLCSRPWMRRAGRSTTSPSPPPS